MQMSASRLDGGSARRAFRRLPASLRVLPVLGSVLCVTACAGAHVTALQEQSDAARPGPLAVVVDTEPAATPAGSATGASDRTKEQAELRRAAAVLQRVLIAKLASKGIAVDRGDGEEAGLALSVELGSADGGGGWQREVVGFGVGQARLTLHAGLEDRRPVPPTTVLAFNLEADSGNMPGLLVSVINPIALAVRGSVAIAKAATDDGHKNVDRAAGSIANKVAAYYRTEGWLPQAAAS